MDSHEVRERDARQSHDGSFERRPGPEGGTAANLPKHVTRLGPVREDDRAAGSRGERRGGLENPDAGGVVLSIQRQGAGNRQGRRRTIVRVDAANEGQSPQLASDNRRCARAAGGIVVRGRQVALSALGDRVVVMVGARDGDAVEPGTEPRFRRCRPRTDIAVDGRGARIRDSCARQDGERVGGAKTHRGDRRGCKWHESEEHEGHDYYDYGDSMHENRTGEPQATVSLAQCGKEPLQTCEGVQFGLRQSGSRMTTETPADLPTVKIPTLIGPCATTWFLALLATT